VNEADEMRAGWPAVLACFATAVYGWGFGLYGQSVLVAALQAQRGWSAFLVSSATSFYYLSGAGLIALTPALLARLGPRPLLIGGAVVLGLGSSVTANAAAPWHMFAGALLMAAGWGCTSTTAIAATLALWFDARRGLAISLALNGASASGFTVAPLLVALQATLGIEVAVPLAAAGLLAVLAPLVLWGTARPIRPTAPARAAERGGGLGDLAFWRVAGPFALALMAQVALLVHLVAIVLPPLGAAGAGIAVSLVSAMAMAGRLALGTVLDRLDLRFVACASFASQAASVLVMLAWPDAAWAYYAGCVGFGLSVGNVITLPSLLIQREFPAARFGAVVGLSTAVGQVAYAFAPALAGLVHDLAGGYAPVLALCAGLQLVAACLVLSRTRRPPPR
jgi:MFS family permease